MKYEGVVLEVKGTTTVIMTPSGQFVKVRVKGRSPEVGELYCGEALGASKTFIRYVALAAAIMLVLLSLSVLRLYYTAYASVVVDINPSIELVVNRWERIIKAVPLNEDGGKVLSGIKLINLSLNTGLKRIVDESIKQEFISFDRMVDGGIRVNIYYISNGKEIELSAFERYLTRANLRYEIKQQYSDKYHHEVNTREAGAASESIKDDAGNRKGDIDGKIDNGTKHNDAYDGNQGRKGHKEDTKKQGDTGRNTEKGNTSQQEDKNSNDDDAAGKGKSDNKGDIDNMNKKENDINKTGANDSLNNRENKVSGQQGQIYGNGGKFPIPIGGKNENTVGNEEADESNVTKTKELNREAQGGKANPTN
ncbi:hypothetical protein JOD02_000789 [Caldicoprobacter guelmensis]|uniref:anti-sigma-I factor RsgI family protein n=1 Tax=Caldicoprobacter guelmensis TaxID=1170224 RepID=UPI00195A2A48|nr:hypothetical protein [Caldicoprobacter guelmensis]